MTSYSQLSKYRQVVGAETSYATPHRLVQLLMESVQDRLAAAKGSAERNDIQGRHDNIAWSVSILDTLRGSLNFEKGGEIAVNLELLYQYMTKRLYEANNHNDVHAIDEVVSLISGLKEAWDAMPDVIRLAKSPEEFASES